MSIDASGFFDHLLAPKSVSELAQRFGDEIHLLAAKISDQLVWVH